jgi:ADP-heptose:LPS heptosyltransferase
MLKQSEAIKIVVLGSKGSSFGMSDNRIIDLCGKTTMHELAAVLSYCSVVAGGDTGPIQLASSLGIPVVVMFGGSDVDETAPKGKVSILKKDYKCSPCRTSPKCNDYPCLSDIRPMEVLSEIKKWIQK